MLAIQYLEDSPDLAAITPDAARDHLHVALEQLPLSCVILGWNLPDVVRRACGKEVERAGAQLFHWHPLLAGDATFVPRPEWRVIGVNGEPVPGFQGLPEFTFICPNRPAVRDAALNHLYDAIRRHPYQGVFLDRMRYPSPVADPAGLLGCFCEDCRRLAEADGFDLEALRRQVAVLSTRDLARAFIWTLLDPLAPCSADPALAALRTFLDFRARSVTRFVQDAAAAIHAERLAVGLDCFSPALTYLVGQDLSALDACCEWIKVMTYGHTLGPAGLPFELLHLAGWLIDRGGLNEAEALEWLAHAARIPLPATRAALDEHGLQPAGLAGEIRRARAAGVRTLLAGIELVQAEGVTRLSERQIVADLRAFRSAGADGLVLSWDLWRMPHEWRELVRLDFGDV